MEQYWLEKEHFVIYLFGFCCCHRTTALLNTVFLFHWKNFTAQKLSSLTLRAILVTVFKLLSLFIQGVNPGAYKHMQQENIPSNTACLSVPWSHAQEDYLGAACRVTCQV